MYKEIKKGSAAKSYVEGLPNAVFEKKLNFLIFFNSEDNKRQ